MARLMTCPACGGTGEQPSRSRATRSGSAQDGNVVGPPADCSTCHGETMIPADD